MVHYPWTEVAFWAFAWPCKRTFPTWLVEPVDTAFVAAVIKSCSQRETFFFFLCQLKAWKIFFFPCSCNSSPLSYSSVSLWSYSKVCPIILSAIIFALLQGWTTSRLCGKQTTAFGSRVQNSGLFIPLVSAQLLRLSTNNYTAIQSRRQLPPGAH